jgi:hypothetical protein
MANREKQKVDILGVPSYNVRHENRNTYNSIRQRS